MDRKDFVNNETIQYTMDLNINFNEPDQNGNIYSIDEFNKTLSSISEYTEIIVKFTYNTITPRESYKTINPENILGFINPKNIDISNSFPHKVNIDLLKQALNADSNKFLDHVKENINEYCVGFDMIGNKYDNGEIDDIKIIFAKLIHKENCSNSRLFGYSEVE